MQELTERVQHVTSLLREAQEDLKSKDQSLAGAKTKIAKLRKELRESQGSLQEIQSRDTEDEVSSGSLLMFCAAELAVHYCATSSLSCRIPCPIFRVRWLLSAVDDPLCVRFLS